MNHRPWIGRWLIGVSVLHTGFALVVYQPVLTRITRHGVFNSVGQDPTIGAVAWFVLFGLALFIAGLALSALERHGPGAVPRSLGWSLLALVLLGLLLMPASGFWLALPPALALLRRPSPPGPIHA